MSRNNDEIRYTAAELARMGGLLARGAVKAQRGKSTDKIDRKWDAIKTAAAERTAAEDTARAKAREQARAKEIKDRAARRAESRWW